MDWEGASSGGIDGRVTGKIALGPGELSAPVNLTDHVHLLPCVIKHDGACPISHYFKPRMSDMVADGLTVEEAYFRGRKLQGVTVPIPNGYRVQGDLVQENDLATKWPLFKKNEKLTKWPLPTVTQTILSLAPNISSFSMEGCSGNKRTRGDAEESPEAKRLHADLFFGILEDDDVGAGDRDPASQELEIVMKSLEEEIGLPPATTSEEEIGEGRQMEIGYLLEASDDELGLPPAGQSSPKDEAEPAAGFGQIWGFEEDGMPGWYEGFSEFGSLPEEKFCTPEWKTVALCSLLGEQRHLDVAQF